jgi:hypothetical protein
MEAKGCLARGLLALGLGVLGAVGTTSAADHYFSDCGCTAADACQRALCDVKPATGGCAASPARGTRENPWCLDPGADGNKESFDYLMDGSAPELAAGDTVRLCAGACDGAGAATWWLQSHAGYPSSNASCTGTYWVVFDMEVDGTSTQPITITPYCSGTGCETVVLSGDANNNNVWDSGVDADRFVSNIDCDGGTYVGGHHYYRWLGDPDGDRKPNLTMEKTDFYMFGMQRDARGWIIDGIEIRYLSGRFFGGANPGADGAGQLGCSNNLEGERGTAINLARNTGDVTMTHNVIHHGCFAALRPINNCNGQNQVCTTGQNSMVFSENVIYNMGAIINGHQGRNWTVRGNVAWDNFDGIDVEEQVVNAVIEDNDLSCRGDYMVNLNGSAWKCRAAIVVSDGDGPPSDGCADVGGSEGICIARDIRVRRNRIYGASYSGESGLGRGYLLGGIAFTAHNTNGDLGSSVVENNMIWHVQQADDCTTGNFAGGAPNDAREAALAIYSSDPVLVQNNTVYDTACWGILVGGGNHVVRNNLVVQSLRRANDTDLPEMALMSNATGSTIQNNNLHPGSGTGPVIRVCDTTGLCTTSYACSQVSAALGNGNKCAATPFARVTGARAAWDLHLVATDTINLNGGVMGITDDIDRQARSGNPDIGADELSTQDKVPPAPPTKVRVSP